METVCVYAVFAREFERTTRGYDFRGVASHPSDFAFRDDDEAEIATLPYRLFIGILADVGTHEIVVKHANIEWEHRGKFTIDPNEGESVLYVVPPPIQMVVIAEKLLNRYLIFVDGQQVGTAYQYWTPVQV